MLNFEKPRALISPGVISYESRNLKVLFGTSLDDLLLGSIVTAIFPSNLVFRVKNCMPLWDIKIPVHCES